jgi:hypothetical protein
MNTSKSEPSALINLLHILTGLLLGLMVIAYITWGVLALIDDDDNDSVNWPITMPYQAGKVEHTMPGAELNKHNFRVNSGSIAIDSNSWRYRVSILILQGVDAFLVIGILLMLRRIIASVEYSNPFTQANVRRLNTIALYLFLFFLSEMLFTIYFHWFIKTNIELTSGEFVSNVLLPAEFFVDGLKPNQILLENYQQVSHLWTSLLVVAITQVFRKGVELKTDNESIL